MPSSKYWAMFGFGTLLIAAACSTDSGTDPNPDDDTGGGTTGVGGTGMTGGTAGVGFGGTSTGGTSGTGTGGSVSGGGGSVSGTGGSVAGSAGSGVAGSSAGAGGSGGGGVALMSWNFATASEGWAVLTGTGASTPETLSAMAMAMWTGVEGNPAPGSLEFTIPFSAGAQWVSINVAPTAPAEWDFSNRTLRAVVKLVSGLTTDTANPGGAKAFAKSGDMYVYADGTRVNVGPAEVGTWVTLTLPFSTPATMTAGYDAAHIRQIGIQIDSGSGTAAVPAVIHVDSITIE